MTPSSVRGEAPAPPRTAMAWQPTLDPTASGPCLMTTQWCFRRTGLVSVELAMIGSQRARPTNAWRFCANLFRQHGVLLHCQGQQNGVGLRRMFPPAVAGWAARPGGAAHPGRGTGGGVPRDAAGARRTTGGPTPCLSRRGRGRRRHRSSAPTLRAPPGPRTNHPVAVAVGYTQPHVLAFPLRVRTPCLGAACPPMDSRARMRDRFRCASRRRPRNKCRRQAHWAI